MSSSNDIKRLMKQTQRYWYEDGFQDMGFGAFILMIGFMFVGEALTPAGSPLWALWGMGGPLLLIGGGLVVAKVVQRLKERISWPRTGYVSYNREHGKSRAFRLALAAVISAVVAAGMIIIQKNWMSWAVILGIVYMATFSFVAYRFGLTRYFVLAFWALLMGLGLAPLPLSVELSGAIFHLTVGLAMVLAGWLTWRQYNQSAPPQEATDGSNS